MFTDYFLIELCRYVEAHGHCLMWQRDREKLAEHLDISYQFLDDLVDYALNYGLLEVESPPKLPYVLQVTSWVAEFAGIAGEMEAAS